MRCAVKNCNNPINSTNRGYSFPTNEAIKKQWLKFCGRSSNFDVKKARVCIKHFKNEDYENSMKYNMGFAQKKMLKIGTVPTINVATIKNMELYKEREKRKEKRENKKIVALLLKEHETSTKILEESPTELPIEIEEETLFNPAIQTEESEDPLNENVLPNLQLEESCIKTFRTELDILRTENRGLKLAYKVEREKIAKITKIYEHNLDELNKRLLKANKEIAILEEKQLCQKCGQAVTSTTDEIS